MYRKKCNGIFHIVKPGETLYSISRKYDVPLELVMHANPYADVYNLRIGSKICVPRRNYFENWNLSSRPGYSARNIRQDRVRDSSNNFGGINELDDYDDLFEKDDADDVNEPDDFDDLFEKDDADDVNEPDDFDDLFEKDDADDVNEPDDFDDLFEKDDADDINEPDDFDDMFEADDMDFVNNPMEFPVPIENKSFAYIVRDGDSIQSILDKFGISMDELVSNNKLEDMLIKPGIAIIIPVN